MFKHIFVTTDGSHHGNAALPVAARLADTCDAQVTVAYVLPSLLGVYEGPYTLDYAHEYGQALERARGILQAAATVVGPEAKTLLLDGRANNVVDCLLEGVRAEGADVIVMSTHGRSGLSRLMLGSVAEGVLRHALVPILLVRAESERHTAALHRAVVHPLP